MNMAPTKITVAPRSTKNRWFKAPLKNLVYNLPDFEKMLFHKLVIIKIGFRVPLCDFSSLRNLDESMGVRVNATNSETRTENATVTPNEKKNLPTIPFINATGKNTTMIAKVVAATASPISPVPSEAAFQPDLPIAR